ncbi:MAG: FAD-dependent oxidoreductase [Sulfolobales archaeon]
MVKSSGLPNLPQEADYVEPEYEDIEKDIVIIGSDPSAVVIANEISSYRSIDSLLIYDHNPVYKDLDVKIDSGVERLDDTSYIGFFEDGHLFVNRRKRKVYRARINKLIFATGTRETYPIFENNDLPGIISSDLFLRLLEAGCDIRNKRIVVLGHGWWGRYVASKAVERKGDVTILTSEESVEKTSGYRVIAGVKEVRGEGYPVIKGLKYFTKDTKGFVEADLVVSALHRQPVIEPLLQLKAEPAYTENLEAVTIYTNINGETSAKNIYMIGEATGTSREDLIREAELLARFFTGRNSLSEKERDSLKNIYDRKRIVDFYSKIVTERPRFYLGGDDIDGLKFICLCEDVTLNDVIKTYDMGYETLEKIKRYTALGTGSCQGRWCKYTALMLLSYFRKVPLGSLGLIRQRPPLEPVEIGLLGGEIS